MYRCAVGTYNYSETCSCSWQRMMHGARCRIGGKKGRSATRILSIAATVKKLLVYNLPSGISRRSATLFCLPVRVSHELRAFEGNNFFFQLDITQLHISIASQHHTHFTLFLIKTCAFSNLNPVFKWGTAEAELRYRDIPFPAKTQIFTYQSASVRSPTTHRKRWMGAIG